MSETNELDYKRLWSTLLKLGLKNIFNTVRNEFVMNLARSGKSECKGKECLEEIISESEVLSIIPELAEYARKAIGDEDNFKHYYYETPDKSIMIEYFANTSQKIPEDFVKHAYEGEGLDYDIDGNCTSIATKFTVMTEDNEPETIDVTMHVIVIGEPTIDVDMGMYPVVIKHELTHVCLFHLRKSIMDDSYKSIIPSTWTDEEVDNFVKDVNYLLEVLEKKDEQSAIFVEFVCDFMMFEADGQTKVKNPIVESRVPKTTKQDSKPKVTYRTLTPFDRFLDMSEIIDNGYNKEYEPIIDALRSYYDNYESFLEEIRMY